MIRFREIKNALLHLLFPHICAGCTNDILDSDSSLCMRCIASLPETGFALHEDNPVANKFTGRLQLQSATAQYYFTKSSLIQQLIHQLKYKGHEELGLQLGQMMGRQLVQSGRFQSIDILVPLPLFAARQKKRGYNQAAVLCRGMAKAMNIPVYEKSVERITATESQTKKGRIDRWLNTEGKFRVKDEAALTGKHLLLVDDVITTGATLEACGAELVKIKGTRVSIAALCYATR